MNGQTIRNRYRELKVHFKETTALARVFTVTFRLYEDGVGFRYEFPEQPNLAQANIADELTEFVFASDGTAWWKPAFLWNREEYLYNKTPLSAVSNADTPITIKLADGTHVALHEAALGRLFGHGGVSDRRDNASRGTPPRCRRTQSAEKGRLDDAMAYLDHRE